MKIDGCPRRARRLKIEKWDVSHGYVELCIRPTMLDWCGFTRMSLFSMHGGPKDRVDQPLTIRSQKDTRTMKTRS